MRYKGITTDTKPWYKHFWPWFIIFIIFWTFMSGVGMLYFATSGSYSMVDGFTKVGKVILEGSRKKQRAKQLGITGAITLYEGKFKINLKPPALLEDYANLRLHVMHPTLESMDKVLKINRINDAYFSDSLINYAPNSKIKLTNNFAGWSISGSLNSGLKEVAILLE